MPSKDPRQRLQDIIENCALVETFTAGTSLAAFASDAKVRYAAEEEIRRIAASGGE